MLSKKDKQILDFISDYHGATIKQIGRIFYKSENRYDCARIKLKKLFNAEILDRYTFDNDKEFIYCISGETRFLSKHDYYNLEFYSHLVSHGAKILKFKMDRTWKDKKRTDGFYEFEYNDEIRLVCLEVDFTHMTNIKEKYVPLYNRREIQEEYKKCGENIFPKVIVMTYKKVTKELDYPFELEFINFDLDNFVEKVLI
jgi:hypothetical protein